MLLGEALIQVPGSKSVPVRLVIPAYVTGKIKIKMVYGNEGTDTISLCSNLKHSVFIDETKGTP